MRAPLQTENQRKKKKKKKKKKTLVEPLSPTTVKLGHAQAVYKRFRTEPQKKTKKNKKTKQKKTSLWAYLDGASSAQMTLFYQDNQQRVYIGDRTTEEQRKMSYLQTKHLTMQDCVNFRASSQICWIVDGIGSKCSIIAFVFLSFFYYFFALL